MMVSPRKRPRVSIVAGLRVATGARFFENFCLTLEEDRLTRVVVIGSLIYDETIWPKEQTCWFYHSNLGIDESYIRLLWPEDGGGDVIRARLGRCTAGISHDRGGGGG
jgi:hypothetical protein